MAGHDYSKFWLHKMGLQENPNCNTCDEPETSEHALLKCPRFQSIREKFSFVDKFQSTVDILKTNDIDLYKKVLNYIKKTNIKI